MIHESQIDEKVCHILQTLSAFGFLDKPAAGAAVNEDDPASSQTALDIAREGVVLLKNDDGLLPLKRSKGRILVLGPNAERVPHGGGSGAVTPFHTVSVYDGLKLAAGEKAVEILSDKRLYAGIDSRVYPDSLSAVAGDGRNGLQGRLLPRDRPRGRTPAHAHRTVGRRPVGVTALPLRTCPPTDIPSHGTASTKPQRTVSCVPSCRETTVTASS